MAQIDFPSKLADSALLATVAKLRRRHQVWLNSSRADDLYCWRQRDERSGLKACLRADGGVAGCAS